jgi:lipid II:glycine glycyltransferase (peptidoglycan interpeptide bridge formation enzyme)
MALLSALEWDKFLSQFPNAHLLQTSAWGELKDAYGWATFRVASKRSGAQMLIRSIGPGLRFAYIPKGPVGDDWNYLWPDLDHLCRKQRVIFLKVEPDLWETRTQHPVSLLPPEFLLSPHTIQPVRTLLISLNDEEDQILNRMKQKTRYNINLALKKGVIIRPLTDLHLFHSMMELTGQRDQFGVHSLDYYRKAYSLFHSKGFCELLLAEFDGTPLAALMVFIHGKRAYYLYGASSDAHRDRMPNYLLQWEAMRWAKARGCEEYDLWGVPDADIETLEANFTSRKDGLWSVYRFKRGFGGQLVRALGAWDRVYHPMLYKIYRLWMSRQKSRNDS